MAGEMRSSLLRTLQCLCLCRACPRAPSPRTFTAAAAVSSGHNRWSKIKHDKGKTDARRCASFSKLSQEISHASHEGGPSPVASNFRLAAAMAAAKKAGMAKDRINHAIQRGQGKSSSGATLEPLLIGAMSSGNVAIVIDCLTDNKLRALQDIKLILSKYSAQATPTNYLFTKKGVVRIKPGSGGHSFDNVLETALEAEGTEDVQEGEGKDGKPEIHVLTEPSKTGVVTRTLRDMMADLEVLGHSIEWVPNEDTMTEVPENEVDDLSMLIERLEDLSDVNEVYTNARP